MRRVFWGGAGGAAGGAGFAWILSHVPPAAAAVLAVGATVGLSWVIHRVVQDMAYAHHQIEETVRRVEGKRED